MKAMPPSSSTAWSATAASGFWIAKRAVRAAATASSPATPSAQRPGAALGQADGRLQLDPERRPVGDGAALAPHDQLGQRARRPHIGGGDQQLEPDEAGCLQVVEPARVVRGAADDEVARARARRAAGPRRSARRPGPALSQNGWTGMPGGVGRESAARASDGWPPSASGRVTLAVSRSIERDRLHGFFAPLTTEPVRRRPRPSPTGSGCPAGCGPPPSPRRAACPSGGHPREQRLLLPRSAARTAVGEREQHRHREVVHGGGGRQRRRVASPAPA